MKVTLIDYTGAGSRDALYAARLLVFTKNTRINMTAANMASIMAAEPSFIEAELQYIADTIPSSWEFIDYTFAVEGVTRAYTHQQVRTRHGSYAQQSMRVTDMSGFKYLTPDGIKDYNTKGEEGLQHEYDNCMFGIQASYAHLIELGASEEDARGVLPTNILTNIVCKFNLRTMAELIRSREGGRTQSEYREVIKLMGAEILRVHPWASVFLYPKGRDHWKELEDAIHAALPGMKDKAPLLKIIDKLRRL